MAAIDHPTTGSTLPNSQPSGNSRAPWIYGPALDLIVGCGGWSAPLLLVAFLATKSHAQQWSVAFYFLALLFNYPHFMATVYRAYHTREQFEKYRIFTVHMALLLVVAGVLAHKLPVLLPWLFTLYVCWSPWHYTGQNFGLLMMFTRRAGLAPERSERRALYAAFIASYVLLMLSFHTGPSTDEMVLSLNIPARLAFWPKAACAVFFLGCGGWVLARFWRRGASSSGSGEPAGRRGVVLAAPVTLFLSQFLWFVFPVGLELTSKLQVPQTRYSTGILAVLHSTQYIWITSYYQRRESRAAGQSAWRFGGYFATLVAGGIALFIPGPWIVSRLFHADFAASFLTFTALVNIHHFILDGAIWKLRDTRVAALLIDSGEKASPAGAAQSSGGASAAEPAPAKGIFGWLAGNSGGVRALRIAAVLLFCAWGLMDQVRFYWASAEGRLPELQRAAHLNPYDSSLQASIARADQKTDDGQSAIAALTRAVALRPQSRLLQHSLAHALLSAGRYPEAFDLYQNLLSRYPNDVDALVNAGLLAARLGHPEEALDDWRRAVDLDPTQANAQLYLGDALAARGEEQAAARHYRAYVDMVGAHPEQHGNDGRLTTGALIKVADADGRGHRPADAAMGYDAAAALAHSEGDAMMESLALAHHAEFEEVEGSRQRAAAFFQRALALDPSQMDVKDVAADWAEYGQFLRRSGQPERLAFACLLHAEQLLKDSPGGSPGEELKAIGRLREASEKTLGREAAEVRNHLEEVLKVAVSLPAAAFSRP